MTEQNPMPAPAILDSGEPAVLHLHSNTAWPEPAIPEHIRRSLTFTPDQGLEARVALAVAEIEDFGAPMHVLASGADGAVAVRLSVSRPDLVKSLVLADCSAANDLGDVTDELTDVPVPALVVAACPDGRTGLEESQTLAGQIPNGVFVVMDHVELPAHGSRPTSFNAWSDSFLSIVEGLRALDDQPVEPTANPA